MKYEYFQENFEPSSKTYENYWAVTKNFKKEKNNNQALYM